MAGLAFGAAALGGGFALAAAGYQAGTGFTARHEASHVQQVEATRRYIDGFERAYKEGQVSEDDWLKFLAIRTKAGDDEKTYEDSIEAYKETPMFNVVGKLKRRREVRRKKKALRRSNRSLRSHYDDCSSGASDTSSISASHGSPPRSRAAYSDEDDTQISNWAKMVAASDVDAPLQQKRRRLDDAASLECKDMDEIQCRGLRCLQVLQPRSHIMALAFSPDSTRIVSGSSTGQIQIWDVHDGNFSPGPLIMTGHTELVESVSFSPDGNQIVSGSWDGTLRIWDAQTGICTAGPLAGHSDYIWCAAFSPDGQMVASGSDDTTIRIWDARTGRVVAGPLSGHTDRVRTVSFSPDSKRVVSASYDCTIRVWDARTGATVVGPLKNDNDRAFVCAVFNPDGERLLSVSGGSGTIHSWNAKTGLIMSSSPQRKPPSAARVSFSQDCSYVVWGSKDGTVSITDILTGENIAEPLTGHTDQVNCIAVCPDGSRIASGSYDKTIRIWDVDACRQRYLPKEPVGFYGFY